MKTKNQRVILLVEDDEIIAKIEEMMLAKYGYNVVRAETGEKAVDMVGDNPEIKLILMDINLGDGIDGTQAADLILKKHDIPIVFLSSHTEPEVVEKTECITSYGYVVKNSGITILDASIKMAFKLFGANKEISDTRMKQNALISNISDVIGIIGVDGIMKYESPNIEKWFGWKPEDLVGVSGWDTVHPDDLIRMQKIFNTLLKKEDSSMTVEYLFKCKDGSYKPIELTGTNLMNDPTIEGVLLNFHDIAARKLVEEVLKESEEKYRLLYTSMDQGLALHEIITDSAGKPIDYVFLDINASYTKLLGLTREMSIGKRIREVMPEVEDYWIEIFGEVALTGKPCYYENFLKETGKYYSTYTYSPKKNQFAVLVNDISAQRIIEKELAASEVRYRSLFESSKDGILILDADTGMIVDANPFLMNLLGFSKEQLLGKNIWEIGFLRDIIENKEKFLELQDKEYLRYEDMPLETASGKTIEVEFISNVYEVDHKKIIQCNIRDISIRTTLEKSYRDSENRFKEVLENMLDIPYKRNLKTTSYDYLSPLFSRTLGYTEEEINEIISKDIMSVIHPEDLPKIEQVIAESMVGSPETAFQVDYRLAHKQGNYHWFRDQFIVMKDEEKQAVARIGSLRDITEQKYLEKGLEKSRKKLHSLIAGTNVGTWEWNIQTGETVFDERWAEIAGYKLEELQPIGIHTWRDLVHPEDLQKSDELLQLHFTGKSEFFSMDIRMQKKDDSWVWVFTSGKVIEWDETGNPLMMFGTHTDINERKINQ